MLTVQKDVYSAYGTAVARAVAAAYGRRGGPAGTRRRGCAAAIVGRADGKGPSRAGADCAADAAAAQSGGRERVAGQRGTVRGQMSYPVIAKLLEERPAGWFADYDAVLVQALADAVAEGRKEQGADVGAWKYGRHLQLTIRNPIAGRIPVLGTLFNIGPVPMSGSPTSR